MTKEDEEWKIEDLSEDDLRKLSGLYGVTDVNYNISENSDSDLDASETTDDQANTTDDKSPSDDNLNDTTNDDQTANS